MATARPHLPYALLKPTTLPIPSTENIILFDVKDGVENLSALWEEPELGNVGALTLDLETKGTHPEFGDEVVGISFADDRGAIYVDVREIGEAGWRFLLQGLHDSRIPLAAYNVSFDAAFLMRDLQKFGISKTGWLNWKYDAYAMYRHLATEGWASQGFGLKQAQVDLLGWELKGDEELSEWLIREGYKNGAGNAQKGEMWRAPKEILGKYCALDSYSTKDLLEYVLLPVHHRFPILPAYHEAFISMLEDIVGQQLRGIKVDVARLQKYRADLALQIERAEAEFRANPEVAKHLREYRDYILKSAMEQEPTRYKKRNPPKAPSQKFRKDGTVTQSWVNYEEKLRQFAQTAPEETVAYQNWVRKVAEVESMQPFNLNSGEDKRWLFYDKMGLPVKLTTDSGLPAVDNKALLGFGAAGKLLGNYNDLVKEASYVDACLEKTKVDGRLHPHFRTPGTLTGRLSGSDSFNLQQQSKTPGYLSCLVGDPGNVLVDRDFSAVEPHMLAAASQDQTLMGLYGPGAPATTDVYIEVGARIAGVGQPFLDCGYVPGAPTKDAIGRCKKEQKKLRNLIKVIHLACSYGAGITKIFQTLTLAGEPVTREEVETIYKGYWDLFADIKKYEQFINAQLDKNKGWALNPIGRPIGVAEEKRKDCVNRMIQSSGHDTLVLSIQIFKQVAKEMGLSYFPYITNFHDEHIVECTVEDRELAMACFKETDRRLNVLLKGPVTVKGEADSGFSLAHFKCEDYTQWLVTQPPEVQRQLTPTA